MSRRVLLGFGGVAHTRQSAWSTFRGPKTASKLAVFRCRYFSPPFALTFTLGLDFRNKIGRPWLECHSLNEIECSKSWIGDLEFLGASPMLNYSVVPCEEPRRADFFFKMISRPYRFTGSYERGHLTYQVPNGFNQNIHTLDFMMKGSLFISTLTPKTAFPAFFVF